MKTCDKCVTLGKKNKVLEAEMKFQLKKLDEDVAHQKITQHLNHQKEMQKINEKLKS